MGRPIKKKFFGNLTRSYVDYPDGGRTGVGAEGIATIVLSTTSLAVSTGSISVVISAPNIAGGIQAVGTAVKTGNTVTSVTLTDAGTGYTTAPTVSFTGTGMTSWLNAVSTVTMTTSTQDAIQIISYLTTGSSAISGGDIMKQESSRRYLVQNAQGQGTCILATGTLTPGQMHIIATDAGGATYYVTKLTARLARVTNRTNTSTAYWSTGEMAPWTIGNATTATGYTGTGVISLSHTV